MKTITLFAIAVLFSLPIIAQTESTSTKRTVDDEEIKTIFGSVESHGGYWAFNANYSQIDGENAIFFGGRGSWVIGHSFSLGLGGGGFFNDYKYDPQISENLNLEGGYGGITFEGIVFPKFPAHLSIPVFIGVGGVSYTTDYYSYNEEDWTNNIEASTGFLIVEPGVEIELNLVRGIRFGLGATYRYTSELDLDYERTGLPSDVLNGLTLGASLKFGKF